MKSLWLAGGRLARELSPAVWLACWTLAVVSVQRLSGPPLALGLLFLVAFARSVGGGSIMKLLRRSRFLFLALFVLFAFFSPGTAVLADFPGLSPTREGLELAAIHLGRLACVIALVAILLSCLSPSRLVGGLVSLLTPMRLIGVAPERLAVRLSLVLELAQSPAEGGWRSWLHPPGELQPRCVEIERRPMRGPDVIALLVLLLCLWWLL